MCRPLCITTVLSQHSSSNLSPQSLRPMCPMAPTFSSSPTCMCPTRISLRQWLYLHHTGVAPHSYARTHHARALCRFYENTPLAKSPRWTLAVLLLILSLLEQSITLCPLGRSCHSLRLRPTGMAPTHSSLQWLCLLPAPTCSRPHQLRLHSTGVALTSHCSPHQSQHLPHGSSPARHTQLHHCRRVWGRLCI